MDHEQCVESIQLDVMTTAEEGYESLISQAMKRVSEYLPTAAIKRRREDCGDDLGTGNGEEWYMECAHSNISDGGQSISGTFTFIRYEA